MCLLGFQPFLCVLAGEKILHSQDRCRSCVLRQALSMAIKDLFVCCFCLYIDGARSLGSWLAVGWSELNSSAAGNCVFTIILLLAGFSVARTNSVKMHQRTFFNFLSKGINILVY